MITNLLIKLKNFNYLDFLYDILTLVLLGFFFWFFYEAAKFIFNIFI